MHNSILTADRNVGRFSHVIATIEPVHQIAVLGYDEHRRRHTIHRHNVTLIGHRQPGYDVNVATKNMKSLVYFVKLNWIDNNGFTGQI